MTPPEPLPRGLDRAVPVRLARGARRLARGHRPHALTIAACLAVGAALSAVVWQANRAAPGGTDTSVGQVVRIGVAQGASIPAYEQASRAELATLADTAPPGYALISLSAYLAPERLATVLAGLEVVDVYVRVPLARTQTEIVRIPVTRLPEDLGLGMRQVADRKTREAAQYREQLSRSPEPQLADVYSTGAVIADAEATAYAERCSCAYAAVVRAGAVALRTASGRAGVRTVDPAPEVGRLDRAVFLPPLPEQHERATPP